MPHVFHRRFPFVLSVVHDMSNQAEVAFDEDVAGFQVALGAEVQVVFLLLGGQGFGEAAGG